jgi:hypothetical protein
MKCAICGGTFVPMPVVLSDDGGTEHDVSRLRCKPCGDSRFSPEQDTALKVKQSRNE